MQHKAEKSSKIEIGKDRTVCLWSLMSGTRTIYQVVYQETLKLLLSSHSGMTANDNGEWQRHLTEI